MAKIKWKVDQDSNNRYMVWEKALVRWYYMSTFDTKKKAEKYIKDREEPSYYDEKGNLIK